MDSGQIQVARWETRGRDFLALYKNRLGYRYIGAGCGGVLPDSLKSDADAIKYMETGPCAFLKSDRPSLRRVS